MFGDNLFAVFIVKVYKTISDSLEIHKTMNCILLKYHTKLLMYI